MIAVHVNRAESLGLADELIRRAVVSVVRAGGVAAAEVSVTFLGDLEIQALNRSYLGHDWPTDVLSFSLDPAVPGRDGGSGSGSGGASEGASNSSSDGSSDPVSVHASAHEAEPALALLGDVYIGVGRARAQAEERGIPVEEEGVRLAVHGALHLLGRDHPEGPEREESAFFQEQESWVATLLAEESDG